MVKVARMQAHVALTSMLCPDVWPSGEDIDAWRSWSSEGGLCAPHFEEHLRLLARWQMKLHVTAIVQRHQERVHMETVPRGVSDGGDGLGGGRVSIVGMGAAGSRQCAARS